MRWERGKSYNEWYNTWTRGRLDGSSMLMNKRNEQRPNISCCKPWAMWCGIYHAPVEARISAYYVLFVTILTVPKQFLSKHSGTLLWTGDFPEALSENFSRKSIIPRNTKIKTFFTASDSLTLVCTLIQSWWTPAVTHGPWQKHPHAGVHYTDNNHWSTLVSAAASHPRTKTFISHRPWPGAMRDVRVPDIIAKLIPIY